MIGAGVAFALASIGYTCLLLFLQHSAKTPSFLPIYDIILDIQGFDLHLVIALYWAISLFFLVPPSRKHPRTLELREYGILRPSAIRFITWSKVAECHWISPKTLLGVSLCWRIPKFFKRGRLTINENKIAPGQKEAVTAVLGRFAPVYDRDGTLLAKPEGNDSRRNVHCTAKPSSIPIRSSNAAFVLRVRQLRCESLRNSISARSAAARRDGPAGKFLSRLQRLSRRSLGLGFLQGRPKADRRRFGRRGAIEPTIHVGPYGRSRLPTPGQNTWRALRDCFPLRSSTRPSPKMERSGCTRRCPTPALFTAPPPRRSSSSRTMNREMLAIGAENGTSQISHRGRARLLHKNQLFSFLRMCRARHSFVTQKDAARLSISGMRSSHFMQSATLQRVLRWG